MELDVLIKIENDFQQKLKGKDYTIIAPVDGELRAGFIKAVNNVAPSTFYSTIHDSLRHKESVIQVLNALYSSVPLHVYVITPLKDEESMLFPICSIDEYQL